MAIEKFTASQLGTCVLGFDYEFYGKTNADNLETFGSFSNGTQISTESGNDGLSDVATMSRHSSFQMGI